MGVSVFQNPTFVRGCASLAGVCFAAAVAVWARALLGGLAARFLRLSPSGKAALVAFVAVATAVAQKDGNVATDLTDSRGSGESLSTDYTDSRGSGESLSTDYTDSRGSGESLSTDYTDSHGLGEVVSDRIDKIDMIEEKDVSSLTANNNTKNLVNPVNPVRSILRASVSPCEECVSDDDIVRSFRLVEVRTHETVSYEMPTNATVVGTWHLTDAYDAVVRVGLGEGKRKKEEGRSAESSSSFLSAQHDKNASATTLLPSSIFLFPLGRHVATSLWAHVWGKARPQLKNASNELVAVGAPMFARHGISRLWTASTTNGSVLVTWERLFLGNPYEGVLSTDYTDSHGLGEGFVDRINKIDRIEKKTTPCLANSVTSVLSESKSTDPTPEGIRDNPCNPCNPWTYPLISAQLELFPSGDFIARSNEVVRTYRRVNPDDWDDDGIPNDEDDNPRIAADETQFGPHQDLSVIAHSNNYYWVDLVVPQANDLVTFAGDGASNLADPSFVAKAGETNRVVLLLGKCYTVACRLPLVCTGASHADVEIGEDEDGRLTVCRPVRCEIADGASAAALCASAVMTRAASSSASGGRRVRFTPEPDGLGVTWNENYCCLEPPPPPFTVPLFNCGGDCGCGGCAVGTYTCRFEGFEMSFPNWPCGCSHESTPEEPTPPGEGESGTEPQGPSASAAFSASAIIFEDEYENAPGETVARNSTETEVEFNVYGGTKGGAFSLALHDGGRLERTGGSFLPREGKLEPGESFRVKVKCRARAASGSEGDIKAVATFTEEKSGERLASEATLTAIKVVVAPVALREGFPNRHRMGVRESFRIDAYPQGLMSVRRLSGWLQTPDDAFVCPIRADANGLEINAAGVSYVPSLTVVEPAGILCTSGFNRCADGLIAMELEPYITPLDVSFFGIKVMEVPTTGSVPIGYFANPIFEPIWNHTRERKAGVWHRPRQDNYFFADAPSFGEYCPPPYSSGIIDWPIPLSWGDDEAEDVSDAIGTFAAVYHQVFTIDAMGGLRIDKFSQWLHCSADGVVTHSPGIR